MYWYKATRKWGAHIHYKAKEFYLGSFASLADAIERRLLAEKAVAEGKHPKPCDGKQYQRGVDHLAAARSAAGPAASCCNANKRKRPTDASVSSTPAIAESSAATTKKVRTSMPLPRSPPQHSSQPQTSTAERLDVVRELLVMERHATTELHAALARSEHASERLRSRLAAAQREVAMLRASSGDDS